MYTQEEIASRKGDWMQTWSGKPFWPCDPRPEDIDINDIAHALSMQCRYAGHVTQFYSVAEHCVIISRYLLNTTNNLQIALWGLLHDATEAYLVDIPKPLKPFLANYKEIEDQLMECIAAKFGLEYPEPRQVKSADRRILGNERKAILKESVLPWFETGAVLPGVIIECWQPEIACQKYLETFAYLIELAG